MHYLYRRNHTKVALAETQDASSNIGVSMELPDLWGAGSLYAEGDYQQLRIGDKVREGKAAYGTLDVFFGDTSILVEGLYLDGFLQEGAKINMESLLDTTSRQPLNASISRPLSAKTNGVSDCVLSKPSWMEILSFIRTV